jgi:hypothetical protein
MDAMWVTRYRKCCVLYYYRALRLHVNEHNAYLISREPVHDDADPVQESCAETYVWTLEIEKGIRAA